MTMENTMDRPIKKKTITPKRIAMAAGGLFIVILIILGLKAAGGGSVLRVESEKIIISEIRYDKFLEFIPVQGTIMPIKTFYLDALQGGTVVETFLDEGTMVEKGDSILRLDNTDLHLDIMYREAQLIEQINNLRNTRLAMEQNSLRLRGELLEIDRMIRNSRRDYNTSVKLKEKNLISDDEFEQKKNDYEYWQERKVLTLETQKQDSILREIQINQLEESVDRMQSNMEIVRKKLENLVVRAPIAGHLTSLNAEVGESKSRGERLGQIDVLEGFKIRAEVDEYYIARISVGQKGEVKIAGDDYKLEATKVYPEVRNGRFFVDMEFTDAIPENIRRGQTAQVKLALGDLSEAVLLPRGGFFNETGGNWIFVVDVSGDFAVRREIRLGRMNPQVYEVLEGLEPGEKVVTSSYANFKDFDRLVFKN
jgi:HlyD family secretion protein